jgi:hypothetical protein
VPAEVSVAMPVTTTRSNAGAMPHDARVGAAEGEVVGHRRVDLQIPVLVRDVVQVAFRVRLAIVRGGWSGLLGDRLHGDDVLD